MATINFYLDRPDKKKRYNIFLVYQSGGKRFKKTMKEKVLLDEWNKEKQKVRSHVDGAADINNILELERSKLMKAVRELRLSEQDYSIYEVKKRYFGEHVKRKRPIEYLEYFIGLMETSRRRKTLSEYTTIVNDLKEYEKYYEEKLLFENINDEFLAKLLNYLILEKENNVNTIAKKVSTFKTMMNAATKSGYNLKLDFRDFKTKKIETPKVFLNKGELLKLYSSDFSTNYRLEKVKDVFCFGCFTGLRFSDIDGLREESVVKRIDKTGKEYLALDFSVLKTNEQLFVPLNKYAAELIIKYQNNERQNVSDYPEGEIGKRIFPKISNQKLNEYLKEIGESVGLDTPFLKINIIGNRRIVDRYRKFELLSSHAARRTFSVLSLEQGMRVEVLQKILGHKDVKTTMKYVTIMEEVKHNEMDDAWDGFVS